ncbi:MAG: hypothetical protein ABIF01_02470 [Candidatus Micrarchaeota archaeon]
MISLTEQDRKFYRDNADALLGYIKYVEYVLENKDKFGGSENVILAVHIGKFIGRNEIEPSEFEEIKAGVDNLCKENEKAKRAMELLQDDAKLKQLAKQVIEENPSAYMIVSSKGDILLDGSGNPVPNLMKVSLAIARELEHEL